MDTDGFILKSFDDRETAWIMHILHNEPIDSFPVFTIHTRSFYKFCLEFGDAFWIGIAVEVNCKCIHVCKRRRLEAWIFVFEW